MRRSCNLVPRPYFLMRKNSLANQVKFLGLVYALVIEHFLPKPVQNDTNTRVEIKHFTAIREVISDLTISLVLTTFWE